MSGLKKYAFVIEVTTGISIEVQAGSLGDAMRLAQEAPVTRLCHQCSRGEAGEWTAADVADVDPAEGSLVDAFGEEMDFERAAELWEQGGSAVPVPGGESGKEGDK